MLAGKKIIFQISAKKKSKNKKQIQGLSLSKKTKMNSEGQVTVVESELFEGEEIKFRAEGIIAKLESN